jgi:hypothetical protein
VNCPLEVERAPVDVVYLLESSSAGNRKRPLISRIYQQCRNLVVGLLAEIPEQQLECPCRVSLLSKGSDEKVTDIHLTCFEPRPSDVIVDPTCDLIVDDNPCQRRLHLGLCTEPSVELCVAACLPDGRVRSRRRPKRDGSVRTRMESRLRHEDPPCRIIRDPGHTSRSMPPARTLAFGPGVTKGRDHQTIEALLLAQAR